MHKLFFTDIRRWWMSRSWVSNSYSQIYLNISLRESSQKVISWAGLSPLKKTGVAEGDRRPPSSSSSFSSLFLPSSDLPGSWFNSLNQQKTKGKNRVGFCWLSELDWDHPARLAPLSHALMGQGLLQLLCTTLLHARSWPRPMDTTIKHVKINQLLHSLIHLVIFPWKVQLNLPWYQQKRMGFGERDAEQKSNFAFLNQLLEKRMSQEGTGSTRLNTSSQH